MEELIRLEINIPEYKEEVIHIINNLITEESTAEIQKIAEIVYGTLKY